METEKLTSKEYFRYNEIIHFAFITILIILGVFFTYALKFGTDHVDPAMNIGFMYVMPVLAVVSLIACKLLFKQRLKECNAEMNFKVKLLLYRSALIQRFAINEGVAFSAVAAYFLTARLEYLAVSALFLIILLSFKPSREKLVEHLDLTPEEKNFVNDPTAEIV
ncbi:hypothetical protein EYV94_16400 [Puteibacter caeruleilacunae]|nr:hypothetical protein EYV94_16400 [Puteibacter caeruleilacunae]